MNYTQMTEKQINESVAKALGATICKSSFGTAYFKPGFNFSKLSPGGPVDKFDPCNSWADAGPIIEKSGIGIMPMLVGWRASTERGCRDYTSIANENPLRAAMIVFLMMQEQK